MDNKELKKLYGAFLYELNKLGYDVRVIDIFENMQVFKILNKGLDRFNFVCDLHYSDDGYVEAIYVDAVPFNINLNLVRHTLFGYPIKYKLYANYTSDENDFNLDIDVKLLNTFINNIIRNRKVIYYLFNCDYDKPKKFVDVFTRHKFYKDN